MVEKNFSARRLVLCVVLAIVFGMFAEKINAQMPLEILQVTSTKEDNQNQRFLVIAGQDTTKVNALIFKQVTLSPSDYVICYAEGETPAEDYLTVAPKEFITRAVYEVDSIGFTTRHEPVVFFTNEASFSASDDRLLSLVKGQKFEVITILRKPKDDRWITMELLIYRTVPRATPCGVANGEEAIKALQAAAVSKSPDEDSGC